MRQSTFDAGRVSALSDGVFAIAMTLLVLTLKLPDLEPGLGSATVAAVLLEQVPQFASWLLSFAILCRLWVTQHALLAEGDTRSRGFVGWTFLFLGAVAFIPFPTSLLSEHHDQTISVVIFSATLAVAGIALLGMWRVEQRQRTAAASALADSRSPQVPVLILLATAAVSSGVAFFSPGLGAMVWVVFLVLTAVVWRQNVAVSEAIDE
jgi:uncharacterized membrane protein